MEPAFEIAEHHGQGFDARLRREIAEPLFLKGVVRHALLTLRFGAQIELLEFGVG